MYVRMYSMYECMYIRINVCMYVFMHVCVCVLMSFEYVLVKKLLSHFVTFHGEPMEEQQLIVHTITYQWGYVT